MRGGGRWVGRGEGRQFLSFLDGKDLLVSSPSIRMGFMIIFEKKGRERCDPEQQKSRQR